MKELSIEEKAKAYDKAIEKARQLCVYPTSKPFISDLQDLFPELKESEDDRIRKWLIGYFQRNKIAENIKTHDILAWLEKQGEQKSADKIEPKFKVGDWVVTSYGKVNQVVSVDKDGDGYNLDDGVYFSGSWCDMYHLWTIQDAKDGDVLVAPPIEGSNHSEQIFIFKEIKDREYVKNAVEYYCRYIDNEFAANERGYMGQSDDYLIPATKEQCDTLFKAMHNAGCEWDAEKKELRKIEQKSAWSEEDERNIQVIDSVLFYDKSLPEDTCMRLRNWLESLKQRLRE